MNRVLDRNASGSASFDPRHSFVFQLALAINILLLLLRVATYQKDIIVEYGSNFVLSERKNMLVNAKRKVPQIPPSPWMSPLSEHMENGCRTWKEPKVEPVSERGPTGLAVTLLLDKNHMDTFCSLFPAQLEYFLQSQGLDILLVFPTASSSTNEGIEISELLECLNLSNQKPKSYRLWKDSGTSKLKTWEYGFDFLLNGPASNTTYSTNIDRHTSLFLGEIVLDFPQYIQDDVSLLDVKTKNPTCQAPHPNYIQKNRWQIHEMLRLPILKEYEFFIKMEAGVDFVQPFPFNILHDMKQRGAVFAHAGKFPDRFKMPCGEEITKCIKDFRDHYHTHKDILLQHDEHEASSLTSSIHNDTISVGWIAQSGWSGGICSGTLDTMHRDQGRYYTDFIIGRTDYFQSPEVLSLGEFVSEWPDGFFKHHWTDQIFWHFALGLFIGPHYEKDAVVDYTEFRCAPTSNCWWSAFGETQHNGASSQCDNRGSLMHRKEKKHHISNSGSQIKLAAAASKPAKRRVRPYETRYRDRCPPDNRIDQLDLHWI